MFCIRADDLSPLRASVAGKYMVAYGHSLQRADGTVTALRLFIQYQIVCVPRILECSYLSVCLPFCTVLYFSLHSLAIQRHARKQTNTTTDSDNTKEKTPPQTGERHTTVVLVLRPGYVVDFNPFMHVVSVSRIFVHAPFEAKEEKKKKGERKVTRSAHWLSSGNK